jgi:hypothetical protein
MTIGDDILPEEFVARVAAGIELMAFNHAHEPDGVVDASLARIASRIQRDWRALLPPSELSDAELTGAVDDAMQLVRERKREIEAAPFGRA